MKKDPSTFAIASLATLAMIAALTSSPVLAQSRYASSIPKVGEAPEHLQFLSPRCSSMNDAIRTSAARGLQYEATAELQRNYQRECSEDENEARSKLYRMRGETRSAKNEAVKAQTMAQERTQIAQQQCDESKRILYVKKRRTDLTDGERADLQRFEDNYKARCS